MITPLNNANFYGPAQNDSAGTVSPADHNMLAWSFDPANAAGTTNLTNGVLYVAHIYAGVTGTMRRFYLACSSAAVTPTAGQNAAGLYDSNGVLLTSASLDALLLATGSVDAPCTPQEIDANQQYYVGVLVNAVTPPGLSRGTGVSGSASIMNVGVSGRASRFGTIGSGLTAIPGSFDPTTLSGGVALFAGLGE